MSRQFFKTLSLQQDFAKLSRVIVYTGLVALMVSVCATLMYRSNSVTIPHGLLQYVVPLAIAVVFSPLAVFVAYVLRAATIARRTVSVGPFVPGRK